MCACVCVHACVYVYVCVCVCACVSYIVCVCFQYYDIVDMLILILMDVPVAIKAIEQDHGAIKVTQPSMQVNRTLQC